MDTEGMDSKARCDSSVPRGVVRGTQASHASFRQKTRADQAQSTSAPRMHNEAGEMEGKGRTDFEGTLGSVRDRASKLVEGDLRRKVELSRPDIEVSFGNHKHSVGKTMRLD